MDIYIYISVCVCVCMYVYCGNDKQDVLLGNIISAQTTFSVICKRIEVCLQRDADTFGFTLRGGLHDDPTKCRPLTITQIRPGSAADR